jgi:hypothetical protein
MKNLTYDQLIELAPKDRPFQVEVESNPFGEGGKQTLWAFLDGDPLFLDTTIFIQRYIDGVDFAFSNAWQYMYDGKFTLIDPRYQKPEVLKAGQKVRIMESARSHSDKELIGKIFTIDFVKDNNMGVYYEIDMYKFPHYCVMPVEEEEVQEIPELENTLEQLDNLVSKAQDIISKYKK